MFAATQVERGVNHGNGMEAARQRDASAISPPERAHSINGLFVNESAAVAGGYPRESVVSVS